MNTKIQELAVQEDAARDARWAVEKRYEELEEEIKKDFHDQYPNYYISSVHTYPYPNFCVKRCSDDKIMDNFGTIRCYSGDEHYHYKFDIRE